MTNKTLQLNGIDYSALFTAEGLAQLDQYFLNYLATNQVNLHDQLIHYRQQQLHLSPQDLSEFLIATSKYLEDFLSHLFGIQDALSISQIKTTEHNPISIFKKYFVLRRAKKELSKSNHFPPFSELQTWLQAQLQKAPLQSEDPELAIALLGTQYLNDSDAYKTEIDQLVAWCVRALSDEEGRQYTKNWVSFNIPKRIDHQQLLTIDKTAESLTAPEDTWRYRDGFSLTDPRMSERQVQDEVNYCIYCHDHDGDFCSKGFPVKKGNPDLGFKKKPTGCDINGLSVRRKNF